METLSNKVALWILLYSGKVAEFNELLRHIKDKGQDVPSFEGIELCGVKLNGLTATSCNFRKASLSESFWMMPT